MSKPSNIRPSIRGPAPPIPVVGLTGGIGSGKSAAAEIFRGLGVAVVDADQLARTVVEPGRTVLDQITEHFGPEMILPSGDLNRTGLAQAVFSDELALRALNEITHPAILAEAMNELVRLQERGARWAIYEAALIVNSDLTPPLEVLIAVTTLEVVRLRRVMDRDKLSARDVLARMASQSRPETVAGHADILIENDGTLEDLSARVRQVFDQLCSQLGPVRRNGEGD